MEGGGGQSQLRVAQFPVQFGGVPVDERYPARVHPRSPARGRSGQDWRTGFVRREGGKVTNHPLQFITLPAGDAITRLDERGQNSNNGWASLKEGPLDTRSVSSGTEGASRRGEVGGRNGLRARAGTHPSDRPPTGSVRPCSRSSGMTSRGASCSTSSPGTGAMAICEALSRGRPRRCTGGVFAGGARRAEGEPRGAGCGKRGLPPPSTTGRRSGGSPRRGETFDLVILDTPYGKGWSVRSAGLLSTCRYFAPAPLWWLSGPPGDPVETLPAEWRSGSSARYGDTLITCTTSRSPVAGVAGGRQTGEAIEKPFRLPRLVRSPHERTPGHHRAVLPGLLRVIVGGGR